MIGNFLPYSEEMIKETLYDRTLDDMAFLPSSWLPSVSLPKTEINEETRRPFFETLNSSLNMTHESTMFRLCSLHLLWRLPSAGQQRGRLLGNGFLACGGCLRAQAIIRHPYTILLIPIRE